MPWLQVFANDDEEFARVLHGQLAQFDSDGVEWVTKLTRFDGLIFFGNSTGQTLWDLKNAGALQTRQALIVYPFSKLNGIEHRNLAGTLEITLEGLKDGLPSRIWGLRWQIFLMAGKPSWIGPFASHVHASAVAESREPYAQTIYDYCCVLRGTRWFYPTSETEEQRCIEKLPYLTLVGILESARRSFGGVVEQGEMFEQLPDSEPRPARLVDDALRAAAMLKKLLVDPGDMAPNQVARLRSRYYAEKLDYIVERLQRD